MARRESDVRFGDLSVSSLHCRIYQDEEEAKKDPSKPCPVFIEDQRHVRERPAVWSIIANSLLSAKTALSSMPSASVILLL